MIHWTPKSNDRDPEMDILKNKKLMRTLLREGEELEDRYLSELEEKTKKLRESQQKAEELEKRVTQLEKSLEKEKQPLEDRVRTLEKQMEGIKNSVHKLDRRTWRFEPMI